MMKDIIRHKLDYSLLATLAGTFIIYFLSKQSSPYHLVVSTLVFALAYFIWGVWHHLRTGSLTRGVVLEYFLVGFLGIVIVSSLLIL